MERLTTDETGLPVMQQVVALAGADGKPIGNLAAPVTGQKKIAATGTAVQLSTSTVKLGSGVIIRARKNNGGNIVVGPTGVTITDDGAGNGYPLEPGEAISFGITSLTGLYINGTAGDGADFAAS